MCTELLPPLAEFLDVTNKPISALAVRNAVAALSRFAAEFVQQEGSVWTTALMVDIGKTYPTREAALSRVIQWAETGE